MTATGEKFSDFIPFAEEDYKKAIKYFSIDCGIKYMRGLFVSQIQLNWSSSLWYEVGGHVIHYYPGEWPDYDGCGDRTIATMDNYDRWHYYLVT